MTSNKGKFHKAQLVKMDKKTTQPHSSVIKKNIVEDTTKVYLIFEPLVNYEPVAQVQALNDMTK